MFFTKRRLQKRQLTYEKYAADIAGKIERLNNAALIEQMNKVFDAVNALANNITELNSKKDVKIKQKLTEILSITDAAYVDVSERFNKDCAQVVNLIGGGNIGYKLTFTEKRKRKKRLLGEEQRAQLDKAVAAVEQYGQDILKLDTEISALNSRILKEKDETKSVMILRERKKLEAKQRQLSSLKEQNDRIITLADNEEYAKKQREINEKFDSKRMIAVAKEMEKLRQEQEFNDRLYLEINAMTERSFNVSSSVSEDELRELRALKKDLVEGEKQKVFDRSDEVLKEVEEEFDEEIGKEEIKLDN